MGIARSAARELPEFLEQCAGSVLICGHAPRLENGEQFANSNPHTLSSHRERGRPTRGCGGIHKRGRGYRALPSVQASEGAVARSGCDLLFNIGPVCFVFCRACCSNFAILALVLSKVPARLLVAHPVCACLRGPLSQMCAPCMHIKTLERAGVCGRAEGWVVGRGRPTLFAPGRGKHPAIARLPATVRQRCACTHGRRSGARHGSVTRARFTSMRRAQRRATL